MLEAPRLRRAVAADREMLVAMQEAAYAPNRAIVGSTPTPLTWDYGHVVSDWEVWLAEDDAGAAGALILETRPGDLYIQSIAVAPRAKGMRLGNRLLAFAEQRAGEEERRTIRLTANARMVFNIDWYGRKGYAVESIETLGDRRRIHMAKPVPRTAAT